MNNIKPSQTIKDELYAFLNFLKNNKLLCYTSILISIFAYGFPLTHYTLSIDEEIALELGDQYNWSNQGRFGLAFTKILFHFWNTNSVTSTFLAVFLLIISSLLWVYGFFSITPHKNWNFVPGIIIVLIFLTFPSQSENIGFSMMSFELGIGWIATSLSSIFFTKWCITKKNNTFLWSSFILITFATSIYQAFLPAFIMGTLIQFILYALYLEEIREKLCFKVLVGYLGKLVAISLGSLLFYKIIDKIIQIYIPSSGYIENFVAWGKKPVEAIIRDLLAYFFKLLTGDIIHGSILLLPSVIISVILILIYLIKPFTTEYLGNAQNIALLLIGYISTPFLLYMVSGSPVPVRGNLVWPLFTSSIFLFLYILIKQNSIRKLMLIVISMIAFYQANAVAQLFYSDYLRYEEDVKLANEIGYKINDLNLGEIPPYPVVYVGKHEQKERQGIIRQEVLGYSFFEWDGGSQLRISDFMQSLGYDYLPPSEEEKEKAKQIATTMPVWPYKGSIIIKDNIIIVNLSATSGIGSLKLFGEEPGQLAEGDRLPISSLTEGSHDVSITKQPDDSLSVVSGMTDPYFSFSINTQFQNKRYNIIKFEFDSNKSGSLQLFLLPLNGQYSEYFSGKLDIRSGNNKVFLNIPNDIGTFSELRIDPPEGSKIKVNNITFIHKNK